MGKLTIRDGYKSSNPELEAMIKAAAAESPYDVILSSGSRPGDPRQHGKKNAVDIKLVDPATGKVVPNYQSGPSFRIYEKFAQTVKTVAKRDYPKIESKLRWGGYFSGKPGKYGALDLMHFDMAGDKIGMKGGSFEKGLTKGQAKLFPGAISVGMGNMPIPKAGLLDEVSNAIAFGGQGILGKKIDPQEAAALAAQGYNEDGTAWKAPNQDPNMKFPKGGGVMSMPGAKEGFAPIPAKMSDEMAQGRKGGAAGNALQSVLDGIFGDPETKNIHGIKPPPVEITVAGGGQVSSNENLNRQKVEQAMQRSAVDDLMGAVDNTVGEVTPQGKSRKVELKQTAAAQRLGVNVPEGAPVPANKSAGVQAKQDSILGRQLDENTITGGNVAKGGGPRYGSEGYGGFLGDPALNVLLGDAAHSADGLGLMEAIRAATQPKALTDGVKMVGGTKTPGVLDDLLGKLDTIHEEAAAGAANARAGGTQAQQAAAAQNSNSGKNSDGTDGSLSASINRTMDAAGSTTGSSNSTRSTTPARTSTSTPASQAASTPANRTLTAVGSGVRAATQTTPTGSTVTRAQADAIRSL